MKERMYRARLVSPIYWKGKNLKQGDEIDVTRMELDYLGPMAVSVACNRTEKIETAVIKAPENTMKQHRKRQ